MQYTVHEAIKAEISFLSRASINCWKSNLLHVFKNNLEILFYSANQAVYI